MAVPSPRLAVVIGIDHYSGGIPALKNASRDAEQIGAVLGDHGFHEEDGTLIRILDHEATYEALHELFVVRLPGLAGPAHRVIVYFAGHGLVLPDEELGMRGFLLPVDAAREGRARYLEMEVVRRALAGLECHHLLVALDCCSAGAFARARYRDVVDQDDARPLIRARYEAMQRRRAFQVLASASHDEHALDSFEAKVAQDALGEHSPFARAVIEALAPPSAADRDRDGVVTATEIYVHARRVLEAAGLQQTPNLWPLEWHDDGEFTFLFGEPRFFEPRALTREESPYRGLEPFREQDARIFFGRHEAARTLAGRIATSRLVAVVGPSGSGKTSLLSAGVVPRLRASAIVCGPIRPGASPLAALAEALEGLAGATGAGPASDERPIVLILDPLEELVTTQTPLEERASLLELLRAAIAPPGEDDLPLEPPVSLDEERAGQLAACARVLRAIRARLHLVLAMRSDHAVLLGDQLTSAEVWARARHVVPPMNRDELRDCIELPAADRFLVFSSEPGPGGRRLVEALLDELEQMPGGLPLLSVALDEMFRAYVDAGRDDRTLGWDEHHAIGGIDGALRRRAEDVHAFAGCDPEERAAHQASLRELMTRLIAFEAGVLTRRRVRRRALELADPGETERMKAVVAALTEARLVVADGDVIELAHDSLIHGWPRVLAWIDPARAALLDRLATAAAEWIAAPEERKALPLWDDDRLVELRALAPAGEPAPLRLATRELLARLPSTLNRDERAFVEASDRARRRRRTGGRAIVAAVVLVLAGAAGYSEAKRRAAEASDRENRRLLAQSYQEAGWQQLLAGRPQEAWPYLLAARQKGEEGTLLRALIGIAVRLLPAAPILEHHAAVSSAAFSADGGRVLTASSDGTARVWNATTGQLLATGPRHTEGVNGATFSPDGKRVITASDDHTAQIWDADSGESLPPPLLHQGPVWKATFSPDGKRVVTASDDHTARIWDAATGRPLAIPLQHHGVVWSAAFSPDGKRVVTASWDGTARIWDATTGEPLATPLEHQDWVWSAAFSPDGLHVVTASWDRTARVWHAATGKALAGPLQHGAVVRSAAFSPDGTRVVTASSDRTARIWDVATGKLLAAPLAHPGSVRTAAFSPDGLHVVTASYDKTARVWEAATGTPVGTPLQHQGAVNGAAFSPDGTRVVTASLDHTARVWDAATGKTLATSLRHPGGVNRAAFSPDGTRVVTASLDRTARLWHAATGELLTRPLEHRGPVWSAELSPDGTRAVTASDDHTARVWDSATGRPLTAPLEHRGAVNRAALSSDGTRVITASDDHTARIWDAVTGKAVSAPLEHRAPVSTAAFSPDGTRVVTASLDHTARIWDASTGKPLSPPLEHQGWVRSAAFSPDGTRVVTASLDHTARIWNAATGEPLTTQLEHQGGVWSAAFSPDGTRIVTTSYDNTARIWDATIARPVATLLEHRGAVHSAAFSPDGTRIVTASDDRTARIWDTATGKPLVPTLEHQVAVLGAAFSPDGTRIVTASDDHTARIWQTRLDESAQSEWSTLAARSPFELIGTVPVRRAPGSALALPPSTTPTIVTRPASPYGGSRPPTPPTGAPAEPSPPPPARPAEPMPFAPGQIWSGHYVCAQGKTSLVLQIMYLRDHTVDAVFAFSHAESGISGSYWTSGRYDPTRRRLELSPSAWLRQPPGYVAISLAGTVSADGSRLEGSMLDHACSTFTVRRR